MADRVPGKAKKMARKPPPRSAKGKAVPAASQDRHVAALEAECKRLKAELAQMATRLEVLEAQRKDLLNHIDWAIDSLHSLLGE